MKFPGKNIHKIFKEKTKNIFLLFHRILSPEIIMNELVRDNIYVNKKYEGLLDEDLGEKKTRGKCL